MRTCVLAGKTKETAGSGEQMHASKITRLVSVEYQGYTDATIVDKQGRLLKAEAEQETRYDEHFNEFLNKKAPTAELYMHEADVDICDDITSPVMEEIMEDIRFNLDDYALAKIS